jgi:predicted nucleic acid-binding Zn ribbon protein
VTDTEALPPKQPCIACRTAIEPGATICPTCKSWQTRWKNTATFYGSYATALALILSGATYIGKNLYDLLYTIDDAEVLEFSLPGYQVYSNQGTSDLFLSHVESYWQGGNTSIVIGRLLDRGKTYVREETEEEIKRDHTIGHMFIHNQSGDATSLLSRPSSCFASRIFSRDHFAVKQMNTAYSQMGEKLALVNTESTLFYYSANGTKLYHKTFPTVVAFTDLQHPECR